MTTIAQKYDKTQEVYDATRANRTAVTAKFAYDNLCDVTLWVYRAELAAQGMDPWLECDGGMDKHIDGRGPHAGKLVLCHGRTGELYVDPTFTVYASTKAVVRAISRDKELEEVIKKLPELHQRQYDTTTQVLQLITVAHKLGLYDAADVLRRYSDR